MSIVFVKGGLSDLTLERGRIYPYSAGDITIHQDRYLTESNQAKVVDYGTDLTMIVLSLTYLSKDNYDGAVNGLKTWFQSVYINWSANSFAMTDEDGVSHTVRFWQGNFSMPKTSSGRHQIQLIFKEE